MISKGLISEVLCEDDWKINGFKLDMPNDLWISKFNDLDEHKTLIINIYELAHKCKEWALNSNEYKLYSTLGFCKFFWSYTDSIGVMRGYERQFEAPTEPEAIFKACQWILDNKDNQC